MISAIRDICIFMIIAQTILYFVPGDSYMKYVRVLVGIMMILKVTEPIFGFFLDDGKRQEIKNTVDALKRAVEESRGELQLADDYEDIYRGIGEELQKSLAQRDSGYDVVRVDFIKGMREGEERVVIVLSEKKTQEEGSILIAPVALGEEKVAGPAEEERLKELYGGHLGLDAGRIDLVFQ